jgi:hypothetical protein
MSDKWILRLVENAGDMLAREDDKEIAVPKEPLVEDMTQHLSFTPKHYLWTIGWRTYVWQEKETGKFQELTEEEWNELASVGTVGYSRGDSASDGAGTDATGDEGSNPE